MTKLYSPPTWTRITPLHGGLRTSVQVCFCVYKKAGVWHGPVQYLQAGELDGTQFSFTTPTQISDVLAAEMQAAGMPGTYV